MKYLTIILVCLLSVSCLTVRRVEKNCDLFAKICITETETETDTTTTTETETEYDDTTAIVYIPEEKVKDEKPVKVVDEKKKPVPVKKEFINSELSMLSVPFAKSYAQVVNSKLRHELIQTDTMLLFKLEGALKTIKTLETKITSLKQIRYIPIKENTDWANLCIKIVWGLSVLVILGIGFLILKFKSKIWSLLK